MAQQNLILNVVYKNLFIAFNYHLTSPNNYNFLYSLTPYFSFTHSRIFFFYFIFVVSLLAIFNNIIAFIRLLCCGQNHELNDAPFLTTVLILFSNFIFFNINCTSLHYLYSFYLILLGSLRWTNSRKMLFVFMLLEQKLYIKVALELTLSQINFYLTIQTFFLNSLLLLFLPINTYFVRKKK